MIAERTEKPLGNGKLELNHGGAEGTEIRRGIDKTPVPDNPRENQHFLRNSFCPPCCYGSRKRPVN